MGLMTHWEGEPVEVWRQLWGVSRLEIHDRIASTNDRAKELAREPCGPWTVILADAQTHGRGRGDRPWVAPPGKGLLCSVVIPAGSPEWNALAPIRVGLAAAEGVDRACTRDRSEEDLIELKWPNDLVLGGRKVGGILCEGAVNGLLVAGVGINVHQKATDFPLELRSSATSLAMGFGGEVARCTLVTELVAGLRHRMNGEGTMLDPKELDDYRTRDHLKGRAVVSEVVGGGIGMGLTPEGHLLLRGDDGVLRRVRAGSVSVV